MNDLSKCQICGNDAMTGHCICKDCDDIYTPLINPIIAAWNKDAHPAIQAKAISRMVFKAEFDNRYAHAMIDRLSLHRQVFELLPIKGSGFKSVDEIMQKYRFPEFTYQPKQEE